MNDEQLDRLVAMTAAVSDETVITVLDLSEIDIAAELWPADTPLPERGEVDLGRSKRRNRVISALAAAAVALAVLGVFSTGDGKNSAWAAPLVDFAESSPLLILDANGWEIIRANEAGGNGEIDFVNGELSAELHWYTTPFDGWLADRRASGAIVGSRPVPGSSATILRYYGSGDFTALWLDGEHTIEFRTVAQDLATFEVLLDRIKRVDVDTWLTAMSPSVIELDERPATIDQMLLDIELPDGFDPPVLTGGPRISDRYQLGAYVVGSVSCAWIERWLDATESGDDARAVEAVEAMNGVNGSAIIQEMNESGDFGPVVADFAQAMAAGDRDAVVGEYTMTIDDVELNRYQAGLGCFPAG